MIDENLHWNAHVNYLHKKVAKYIYLLKRVRNMIDFRVALLFYRSIIQSHFDYCNVVWGNTGKRNCDKLQVLQNRSLRIVLQVDSMFPSNDLYDTLRLDCLNVRRSKQLADSLFLRAVRHSLRAGCWSIYLIKPKRFDPSELLGPPSSLSAKCFIAKFVYMRD